MLEKLRYALSVSLVVLFEFFEQLLYNCQVNKVNTPVKIAVHMPDFPVNMKSQICFHKLNTPFSLSSVLLWPLFLSLRSLVSYGVN